MLARSGRLFVCLHRKLKRAFKAFVVTLTVNLKVDKISKIFHCSDKYESSHMIQVC